LPLVLAAAAGVAAGTWAVRSGWEVPAGTRLPGRIAAALASAFFIIFAGAAVVRFYNLAYWGTDLGEYANLAYNTAHGRVFLHTYCGLEFRFAHCAPLLFLLSPLACIFDEPLYVVLIVAAAAAATVALVYYVAAARGSAWVALALAVSYALSPYIQGAALYENPFRPVAAALLLGALLAFARRRFGWGVALTFAAAATSEEVAVYAVIVAAWGSWLCGRRRGGVIFTAAAALYAVGVCFVLYPWLAYGRPVLPNFAPYVIAVQERGWSTLVEAKGLIPMSTRLWYFVTALAPGAFLLPAAGGALALLAAPAVVFATHENASIVRHGFAFPFQFYPFVYAAAAFGLHRVSTWSHSGLRRFVLAAGAATAVAFPLALATLSFRPWYVGTLRELTPTVRDAATLAGIRRIPPLVSVSVDQPAFAFVAHRRVATLFPHGLGLDPLEPVEGVFLDRECHGARFLPSELGRLRAAGYYPVDVTRDYAYFARRPGAFTYEEVWRAWYGFIPAADFRAGGDYRGPQRDPRAPETGVALRVEREAELIDPERYFFPPGVYRLTYWLAATGEAPRVRTYVTFVDADSGAEQSEIAQDWTVEPGGEYGAYVARFKTAHPAHVRVRIRSTAPLRVAGVAVEGRGYTLARARAAMAWPYRPRSPKPLDP